MVYLELFGSKWAKSNSRGLHWMSLVSCRCVTEGGIELMM